MGHNGGVHEAPPQPPSRPTPPQRPSRPTRAPSQDGGGAYNQSSNNTPRHNTESYEMQGSNDNYETQDTESSNHSEGYNPPSSRREQPSYGGRNSSNYEYGGSNHSGGYTAAEQPGYTHGSSRGGGYDQGGSDSYVRPPAPTAASEHGTTQRSNRSSRIASGQRYGGSQRQSFDQGYDQ